MSDSRGVALAEIDVKRRADEARAEGRTEFADTIDHRHDGRTARGGAHPEAPAAKRVGRGSKKEEEQGAPSKNVSGVWQ